MQRASDSLISSLGAVWRNLRSMRTALLLLLLLGLATVAGSFIPQAEVSPDRVAALFRDHPLLARVYDLLGFFDVFGSWWFTLIYALLMISLASCLIPRTRGFIKGLRRARQSAGDLAGMRHFVRGDVGKPPDAVLAKARLLLRRRRFRVSSEDGAVAGEKGLLRDIGSLAFHWAFFLLLAGVVIGKGFGFTGQATVLEGETWTEARASYDFPPREGRFFSEGMHAGFQIRVLDFDATFHDSGVPADFVSRVEITDASGSRRMGEIRVNRPLREAGVSIYQAGYGWAPVIEARHDGEVIASEPLVFVTDRPNDARFPWRGVLKLPSLRPQVGIEFALVPDPQAFVLGAPMLEARNPFLTFRAFRGDLRLTRAQNVFTLDTKGLQRFSDGGMGIGQAAQLPGGVELSFPELREYTQFLVKRDPGTWIVLVAAVLVLLGILPALYSSHRRVWVRAVPDGRGSRVEVGGFALQRKLAFAEEFRRLTKELLE